MGERQKIKFLFRKWWFRSHHHRNHRTATNQQHTSWCNSDGRRPATAEILILQGYHCCPFETLLARRRRHQRSRYSLKKGKGWERVAIGTGTYQTTRSRRIIQNTWLGHCKTQVWITCPSQCYHCASGARQFWCPGGILRIQCSEVSACPHFGWFSTFQRLIIFGKSFHLVSYHLRSVCALNFE